MLSSIDRFIELSDPSDYATAVSTIFAGSVSSLTGGAGDDTSVSGVAERDRS